MCSGRVATPTTSLRFLRPDLVAEWHTEKNGNLTPDGVMPGSGKKVWWRCQVDPSHEWQATIYSRGSGNSCPMCARHIATPTTSLSYLRPDLASEWYAEKNGELTPDDVTPSSDKKVWWRCQEDPSHEWEATIGNRHRGSGCPMCSGQIATPTTSLRALRPDLAAEWHPEKNGELTPDDVTRGSSKKVWWRCQVDPSHEWPATISDRRRGRGCPICRKGWSILAIRRFVASLKRHLLALTPAELYVLFQQNGLHTMSGKSKAFVKALATGRFPLEELDKFVAGEASLVDQFIDDPAQTLETLEAKTGEPDGREEPLDRDDDAGGSENSILDDTLLFLADSSIEDAEEDEDYTLPVVETKAVLAALGHVTVSCADEEAVEFLISSALAKIWNHTFRDEPSAVAQAERGNGDEYTERVRKQFLDEYRQAKELPIPQGYAFQVDGKPTLPNLMQRLVAVRVRNHRRVGNWSGTGAGKTLSAVLASRVVDARITIICCPNSVVEGWRQAIRESFPDSRVETKTFDPEWCSVVDETGFGLADNIDAHRYLVLNYEAFQQPESATRVRMLVEREQIDFVIVDEIHYAKQRQVEDISKRRKLVAALISLAAARNPDLYVMGMSATPVINNLQEGKSMVELVTGVTHNDLDTHPTVSNCMTLHQRLVQLGIRWMPNYQMEYEQVTVQVDCSPFLDEIRALGQDGNPLALEQILTRARLAIICQHIKPKTLIYTYYVQGIDRLLRDALLEDGWKVGFYTGEDKSGLDGFLNGNLDVLIGSSAIGTGVDGLQQICNHLIINVLPWTAAEFEQLKGRLYRQGQRQQKVTMVLPLTYAEVNGERWSWCESKVHRLHFKKSIADAAVDGVVPEGHLRTPAQAYQDLMAWLARIDNGEMSVIARPKIVIPLPNVDAVDGKRHKRWYGTFSTMNRTWNQGRSDDTHRRLQENPEEWVQYHALYREARSDWPVIPYEEMIYWCQERSGKVIGDFGCGEAKLAEAVADRHTVYSFDHIAINNDVISCDMTHVPLDDETLDVAIFSLSLMGINFTDYVREAHRTLKIDGLLHIIESTSRFSNRDQFVRNIEELGFAVIRVEDKWKFTHIHALKMERQPRGNVELRF